MFTIKEVGSSNVNKLLSKRTFGSTFDKPHHRDFPLVLSNEDGLLNFP